MLTVWQRRWWSSTAAIVVIVDGGVSGIEPTAQMAASSTVAANDGGGNDGIFTTTSLDKDRHPCPHHPCLTLSQTRIGRQGGGHPMTCLIHCCHGCCQWCHLCLPHETMVPRTMAAAKDKGITPISMAGKRWNTTTPSAWSNKNKNKSKNQKAKQKQNQQQWRQHHPL